MVVRVRAGDLHRLVPHQRVRAQPWRPVEFAEHRFAVRIDQPEGMHAEPLHHPVAARNRAVGHLPHQHVGGLGHQRHEVPESVVRRRRLGHAMVRLGLDRVHQVRELHRVLDEEHRHVVAHQVPVALVGIELHREAAHVARGVLGATLTGHRGEAHEHRGDLARLLERRGAGECGKILVGLEVAMRAGTARMHHALGDAFMVEMGELLAQDEILQQCRPAQTRLETVLVVRDRHRLVGGHVPARAVVARPLQRRGIGVLACGRGGADLCAGVRFARRTGACRSGGFRKVFALRGHARGTAVLGGLVGVVGTLASPPINQARHLVLGPQRPP